MVKFGENMQSCFIEISASAIDSLPLYLQALLELKHIFTSKEDTLKQNNEIKEMALEDFFVSLLLHSD